MLLAFGCAHAPAKSGIDIYVSPRGLKGKKDRLKVAGLVDTINSRNAAFNNSPEALREAYGSIGLRKLNDISVEEYGQYASYSGADKDSIYIIVHPAFYAFFDMKPMSLSSPNDIRELPSKNIVDRLYEKKSLDFNLRVMQEQEEALRGFLEAASMEGKLVLLVLPRNYKEHLNYGYIEGLDEYARYVNDMSNGSESVIYMESVDWDDGAMRQEDVKLLTGFLDKIGVKKVYLGGGYICRCLANFTTSVINPIGYGRVYLVPEISAVSPVDISAETHPSLLDTDGHVDANAVEEFILSPCPSKTMSRGSVDIATQIKHFFIYELN